MAQESANITCKTPQCVKITDFFDNTTIFEKPAKTHIFLSFCEVVPMLDIWSNAVGLSQSVYNEPIFRTTNKNLNSIPKIGGGNGSNVNLESIKRLNPDIVVVWAGNKKEINTLRANGVRVLAFYPNDIKEVFADILSISKALGKEKQALKKQKEAFKILDLVATKSAKIKQQKSALYLWDKPNRIAGKNGMIGDMLSRIGVKNLGANFEADSLTISLERLVSLNPDVIFIWGAAKFGVSDILSDPKLRNIAAVKNKAVYKMPLWDNWGPRIVQTTLLSASLAYPNEYSDVDVNDMISSLNEVLFGVDVK